MKILCLGNVAYDVTIPVNYYPVENTKTRVTDRVECGGGPASNAAYLLGKWGLETWFAGIVGNDEYGRVIKEEFKSVNVNIDFLQTSNKFRTTAGFIISNIGNGSRTTLTYRQKEMQMSDFDLKFEPNFILIDGQEYEMSKKIIAKYPKAVTIIDAGRATKKIIELAKLVKYVVCSKEFAESVTGINFDFDNHDTISAIYLKMKNIFKNNIIITLEARGSLYEKDNIVKVMPSIKVNPIDSTGAGDIFHGAFVYCLAKGFDIEKTLKVSNITGALATTKIGGRNSVFDKKEISKYYDEFE